MADGAGGLQELYTLLIDMRAEVSEMRGALKSLIDHDALNRQLLEQQREFHARIDAATTRLNDRIDERFDAILNGAELANRINNAVTERLDKEREAQERAREEVEQRVADNTRAIRLGVLGQGGVIGALLAGVLMFILNVAGVL